MGSLKRELKVRGKSSGRPAHPNAKRVRVGPATADLTITHPVAAITILSLLRPKKKS